MANLLGQALDKAGLARYTEKVKAALAGKQDALRGTQGQVVGFDDKGLPTAQSGIATEKYVDDLVGDIAALLDSINGEVA